MKRRPTRRAFVLVGIGGLLILAGASAQAGWLFVLAAGVLGLVVGSFVVRPRLAGLEVTRTVPRRARVGDSMEAGLLVRNGTDHSIPLFTIDDPFAAFPPLAVGCDRLGPQETSRVELVRTAAKRGRYSSGLITLRSAAPFGLVRSLRTQEATSEIVVVPNWVDLKSFPILEPSSSPSDVLHERARTGAGEEFFAVREYRPGDPLRTVHWRSTARAGTLVVREFEEEISSRVGVVLSGGDHGSGPASSFEMLVSAVASIGLYALATGHPIHFACPGREGIEHLDRASRDELLDRLAGVEATDLGLEPLIEQTLTRVGRRGTIVICSSTSGVAGASVEAGIRTIQRSGARAILVMARSSSWDASITDHPIPAGVGDWRVPRRIIEQGLELGTCLAA
jgi:uncharacterized protein (DUF58 family)